MLVTNFKIVTNNIQIIINGITINYIITKQK